MIFSARGLLFATAVVIVGGCGGGAHDLSVPSDPLLIVHGHIDLTALPPSNTGAPLLGTLIWADVPAVNPVCLEISDPRIQGAKACPDPYGMFQGVFTGAIESPVMVDADGNFDIPLFHLPKVRASIGDGVTRIAYAALVVFSDDDADGAFTYVAPVGGRRDQINDPFPDRPPDTIVGSTFSTLLADQQRLAFREGGFDQKSFFYPVAEPDPVTGNTFPDGCVPQPGFSILATSPYSAVPICTFPALDTRMEVAPLSAADGLALMCRSVQRNATIQLPQQDEAPGPGAFCPPHADHADREVMVVVLSRFCARLNAYALKGCQSDPFCDTPEWDLSSSPPTWWRPLCP
jgi:hypothetical protein